MNSKAVLGLSAGALVVGLLTGLAVGGGNDKPRNATGPGPSRRIDGVPTGFERSKEGAAAAAAAYAGIVETLAQQPSNTWDASIQRMSAPEVAEKIATAMKPGLQSLAGGVAGGANSILRGAPLGYRVTSYDESSANIEVWGVGVIGSDTLAPSASWGTTAVKLKWVNNDWRLAESMSQSNGPTPRLPAEPTTTDAFFPPLQNLMDLDHVPEK